MSVRTRLVVAFATILVVVVVTGAAVAATQRGYLLDQVDSQLRAAVAPIVRVSSLGPRPTPPPEGVVPPATQPQKNSQFLSDIWAGTVGSDGRLVRFTAAGLSTSKEPKLTGRAARAAARSSSPFTVPARSGSGEFRMLAVRVPGQSSVVVIGLSLDRVAAASHRLVAAMAIGAGVIIAVVGLMAWWMWRLGLRPIRRMTRVADEIARGELDERVESLPARTEAGQLGTALNAMLDERQRNEERLRRFVSDASHELRTPLTSIGGYADLYRRGGLTDSVALDDAMRRIQQETIRMSRLVDDLLLLARLDEARATTRDHVDVAALLRDAAADTAVIDPKRVVSLRVTEPLVTLGDEHELHQVVGAVLSNALRYTKGPIQLIGSPGPHGSVTIEVVDEGPGMDPNVASRIFERFFRGDAGRARGDGGSGLGLAIVKSIVTAHGGQAEVETSPTSGTRIRIVLPGSPPAARRQPELAPHLS